jgi:purine-binding chemotaxis protein CheW
VEVVAFEAGGFACALDVRHVREVLASAPVTRVPAAPPAWRGVLNVRGAVLPALDLGLRLGGAPADGPLVVVEGASAGVCALVAERLLGIRTVEESELRAPPAELLAEAARLVRHLLPVEGERDLLVLDLERLLDLEEIRRVVRASARPRVERAREHAVPAAPALPSPSVQRARAERAEERAVPAAPSLPSPPQGERAWERGISAVVPATAAPPRMAPPRPPAGQAPKADRPHVRLPLARETPPFPLPPAAPMVVRAPAPAQEPPRTAPDPVPTSSTPTPPPLAPIGRAGRPWTFAAAAAALGLMLAWLLWPRPPAATPTPTSTSTSTSTPTPTPTPTRNATPIRAPPPQPASAASSAVVVVKQGDTLWELARRYRSDPRQWPVLHSANRVQIANPDLIIPGQLLVIPP